MNSLDTLKQFSSTLKVLANFTDGEQINVNSSGKIEKASAYTGYLASLINLVKGQDSIKAIQEIRVLFEDMKKFLNEPSNDSFNMFTRLKRLYSIQSSAQKALNLGLNAFKETCQLGKACSVAPTKDIADDLGKQIDDLKTTLETDILGLLTSNIEKINTSIVNGRLANVDELIKFLFTGKDPIDLRLINQPYYSAEHLKTSLTLLFGKRIVLEVFNFYQLGSKGILSRDDIQAITIGIKANLTYDDILFLVKNGSFLEAAFDGFLPIPSLNEENVLKTLHLLRDSYPKDRIDLSNLQKKPPCYAAQLKRDLNFLITCDLHTQYAWNDDCDHSLFNHQHYGEPEYLAKDLIYGLYSETDSGAVQFSKGALFPCYTMNKGDEEKKLSCFQAWPLPGGEGFYPALVLPMIITENAPLAAKILFRGTADSASIYRDINPLDKGTMGIDGPGMKSFYEKLPKLQEELKITFNELQMTYKVTDFHVGCYGHSLGATDCSRYALELVKNKIPVSSIQLFAMNPPAISIPECLDFINLSEEYKLPVECTYFKVIGDTYQEGGAVLPGYFTSEKTLPSNVSVNVVVLDRTNKYNADGCIQLIHYEGCNTAVNHTVQHTVTKHAQRCFTLKDDVNLSQKNPTKLVGIYNNTEHPEKIQEHLITNTAYASQFVREKGYSFYQFITQPSTKTESTI